MSGRGTGSDDRAEPGPERESTDPEPTDPGPADPAGASGSRRVVVTAFLANVGVTAAFTVAAVLTGSASMLAQAIHGAADTGNQAILFVAERHSLSRRDPAHIEAGRAAYFWALVAALSVFVIGGTLSVFEGFRTLFRGESATQFTVAYVVLAFAMTLDGLSWLQAFRQTRRATRPTATGSSSPNSSKALTRRRGPSSGRTSAALIGDVLALTAISLHQITGSSVFDTLGSIAIGLLLGTVAVLLARRNMDFLVGQAPSPADSDRMRRLLESLPGVNGLDELLVLFVGPRQLWIVARVNIDERLSAAQIVALSDQAESRVQAEAPEVLTRRAGDRPLRPPRSRSPGSRALRHTRLIRARGDGSGLDHHPAAALDLGGQRLGWHLAQEPLGARHRPAPTGARVHGPLTDIAPGRRARRPVAASAASWSWRMNSSASSRVNLPPAWRWVNPMGPGVAEVDVAGLLEQGQQFVHLSVGGGWP